MLATGARRDFVDGDGLTALAHARDKGYANIVDVLEEGSAP
jgi:hypothetical protein